MAAYYEIEVSLRHIEPRIWRVFLIPRTATFKMLHEAIQAAGPWLNYHLYEFRSEKGETIAGVPESRNDSAQDSGTIKLNGVFRTLDSCVYEYDFGDSWELDVRILNERRLQKSFKRKLVGGDRSFPPEDSGGIFGYRRIVSFLETGKGHGDEEELNAWLGDWRPNGFDLIKMQDAFDR